MMFWKMGDGFTTLDGCLNVGSFGLRSAFTTSSILRRESNASSLWAEAIGHFTWPPGKATPPAWSS